MTESSPSRLDVCARLAKLFMCKYCGEGILLCVHFDHDTSSFTVQPTDNNALEYTRMKACTRAHTHTQSPLC